jgi:hypothetical protein
MRDKRDLKIKWLAKKREKKKLRRKGYKEKNRVGKVCNFINFIQFINNFKRQVLNQKSKIQQIKS